MSTTTEREIEQLRDEIQSLQSRLRQLEIRAGIDLGAKIPQQRLDDLVAAATRRPAQA